jgi:hypothetical protein
MGNKFIESVVFDDPARQENIFSLTGVQTQAGLVLFACTAQRIYRSVDEETWTVIHESGGEPVIQLTVDPAYAANTTAYILQLGGTFCQGILK